METAVFQSNFSIAVITPAGIAAKVLVLLAEKATATTAIHVGWIVGRSERTFPDNVSSQVGDGVDCPSVGFRCGIAGHA